MGRSRKTAHDEDLFVLKVDHLTGSVSCLYIHGCCVVEPRRPSWGATVNG